MAGSSSVDASNDRDLSSYTAPASRIPDEVRGIVAELTGYPLNIVTLTADIEDELGIDSVMLGEIFSVLRDRYALPPGSEVRARIPAGQLRTIRGIAQAVVTLTDGAAGARADSPAASPIAAPSAAVPSAAAPASAPRSSTSLVDELRQIFAELTSYPVNILSPDADLEDDLGIDSVALGEIFSVLRERYALPTRSELGHRIVPAQLRTIRGIAGIVATFGNVSPETPAAAAESAPVVASPTVSRPVPSAAAVPASPPPERSTETPAKSETRTRTVTWSDPSIGAAAARSMAGLDYLHAVGRGEFPGPPMASLLNFTIVEVEQGRAVAEVYPAEYHYNPIGVVHGGLAATVLDSAMACAVHSTLPAGTGYTTLEFKINLVRALTASVGRLRAVAEIMHGGGRITTAQARLVDDNGLLYAHATETCLLINHSGSA